MEYSEIIYSEIVKYREIGKDVKLNVLDKTIIIEQKKGFFKKEYKVIEIIPIKEVEIEEQAKTIKIKTETKIITIECYSEKDKKRLIKVLEKIKKERKKFKLDKEKLDRIVDILSKTEKIITIATSVAVKIKEITEKE